MKKILRVVLVLLFSVSLSGCVYWNLPYDKVVIEPCADIEGPGAPFGKNTGGGGFATIAEERLQVDCLSVGLFPGFADNTREMSERRKKKIDEIQYDPNAMHSRRVRAVVSPLANVVLLGLPTFFALFYEPFAGCHDGSESDFSALALLGVHRWQEEHVKRKVLKAEKVLVNNGTRHKAASCLSKDGVKLFCEYPGDAVIYEIAEKGECVDVFGGAQIRRFKKSEKFNDYVTYEDRLFDDNVLLVRIATILKRLDVNADTLLELRQYDKKVSTDSLVEVYGVRLRILEILGEEQMDERRVSELEQQLTRLDNTVIKLKEKWSVALAQEKQSSQGGQDGSLVGTAVGGAAQLGFRYAAQQAAKPSFIKVLLFFIP